MPMMNVERIKIGPRETLLVARHECSGKWFASVGDLSKAAQREMVTADTPEAALGELLGLIGGTFVVTD